MQSKRDIKQKAQDELLSSLAVAFYRVDEDSDLNPDDKKVLLDEMRKQMSRIEKLFGYEPYSWGIG